MVSISVNFNVKFVGGDIYVWGLNSDGQLGLGSNKITEIKPVQIASLSGIPLAFIACGKNHTFAISKSGAVFGWGKFYHTSLIS